MRTPYDLVDPFGRTVRDLRISVTDRCNFRCTYCMPAEGMQWLPREDLLTFEEIERLARVFVERFGVDGIRLTGGEPTVRAHLPVLVSKLAHLRLPASADTPLAGRKPDLSMTTNGATFRLLAHELRARRSRPGQHLARLAPPRALPRHHPARRAATGCSTASTPRRRPGFDPVKINVRRRAGRERRRDRRPRPTSGATHGVSVRFIEFMPLDAVGRVGPRPRSWARTRSWPPSTPSTRSSRPAAGERRPPIGGSTPTGGATSASSRASRSRSAATATGCGSPPRVSSAPACSRPGSSTCGRILRGGGSDDELAAGDRAGRRHEVGRPRHRPGHVPPAEPLDEPDRRLNPALPGRRGALVPALAGAGIRCSAPWEL